MKIDDSLMGVPSVRSRKARAAKGKGASVPTTSGTTTDSIEITQTSAQLHKLEEALGQIDTTEAGKLEAVRQAIADGQFHVDEEAVADALIQTSMNDLRRRGSK